MADNSSNSNGSSFLASALGILATIFAFALLVFLGSWLSSSKEIPAQSTRAFPDAPTGASLKAKDAAVLNSYGWVDQEKGIVRIPADRATELIIEELNP